MDQYIGSNKLATYFHPNSSDPFLELEPESIKSSSSPNSSSLLQQNSNVIDLCAFNSLYNQIVETSSSSSSSSADISSNKPFINSSDLYIEMRPVSQIDYSNQSNGIFISSSNSTENTCKANDNMDLTTSIKIPSTNDCSQNISSSTSIPISNSDIKHCISEDLTNKQDHLSTYDDDDYISNYKLTNFIIKVEQIPYPLIINSTNKRLIKDNNNRKQSSDISNKKTRRSPILHRLIASPSKSFQTDSISNVESTQNNIIENSTINITKNPNNKSPQYRPRHSYSSERKLIPSNSTKFPSGNDFNKTSKNSRQSCRSPVFIRRPQQKLFDTDFNVTSLSLKPMTLLSSDSNESILSIDNQLFNEQQIRNLSSSSSCSSSTTIINNYKRSLESSTSEQILIKRRYQTIPTIISQTHYCISYPTNIQRCIDCQTIKSLNLSTHFSGCRFQHCRTLKYVGDDQYEIQGFTTVDTVKSYDTKYLLTPDSSGQPSLNFFNAKYIFLQIAKYSWLMFLHEENTRSTQNEKEIIWKRYMAGWREVCDDCSTTLFNYHYMCKICGYMICIECFNEFSQMNIEKRKKLKRTCVHNNSFCLSQFIPWNILIKLRKACIEYFSKLKIDYSIKLYNSSKDENLSIFIKSLKMKRYNDTRNVQKIWSSSDCNYDPNIEFFCNGRLPVFNEWTSQNAKHFFKKVWTTGCPVLVKQVHCNLSKTLWHPNSFKLHMIDHHETPALWDCETLTPVQTNRAILTRFWDGFEYLNVRLRDYEHGGRSRILKLKDWPTKKDFATVFPTRLHDLMNNIPFSDYTRRSYTYNGISYHAGVFNIVERLPDCLVKPDLGPKLYIAYSQLTSHASRKAGTTNLHIDVSDAVNVLVYVGIGGHGDDGSNKDQEIRQVEEEILNSNIDEAQLERLRNGERPGALWHLFRSDDAAKIREYIGRTQRKSTGSDSIHDQTTYLEKEDLEKLRNSCQVEAYPILQFLGDAIFIPSGAPHQVRNLHSCIKIAEDFVSPENLDRCLITTNEFRSLSKTHTNHADILQAKNILYYATRDALNSLIESNQNEILVESSSSY